MNTRPTPESDSSSDSRMEKIGARVRQRSLTGLEASSIGFVLVGYIGAFSLAGYWLDTYFKTSWIVAVGVLLGAGLGFREMFRMAQKLGQQSVVEDAQISRQVLARGVDHGNKPANHDSIAAGEEEPVTERRRIFQVPTPPTASFDKSDTKQAPDAGGSSIDKDDLFEELLHDGEKDEDVEASQK